MVNGHVVARTIILPERISLVESSTHVRYAVLAYASFVLVTGTQRINRISISRQYLAECFRSFRQQLSGDFGVEAVYKSYILLHLLIYMGEPVESIILQTRHGLLRIIEDMALHQHVMDRWEFGWLEAWWLDVIVYVYWQLRNLALTNQYQFESQIKVLNQIFDDIEELRGRISILEDASLVYMQFRICFAFMHHMVLINTCDVTTFST